MSVKVWESIVRALLGATGPPDHLLGEAQKRERPLKRHHLQTSQRPKRTNVSRTTPDRLSPTIEVGRLLSVNRILQDRFDRVRLKARRSL